MTRRYIVVGPFKAYDTSVGESVSLDPEDAGVQANLAAGVITLDSGEAEKQPTKVACPACTDEGKSRPPKFESQAELDAHYGEKHPALVAPSMKDGE